GWLTITPTQPKHLFWSLEVRCSRSRCGAQHFLYLLGELFLSIWLGEELNIGFELFLLDQRALEIPRDEEHFQRGAHLHCLGRELPARQLPPHDDVGDQQVAAIVPR